MLGYGRVDAAVDSLTELHIDIHSNPSHKLGPPLRFSLPRRLHELDVRYFADGGDIACQGLQSSWHSAWRLLLHEKIQS
jgi:hypothetical protein